MRREAARGAGAPASRPAATVRQPFIVLTGLSGSGKSQAIRALEDLGYFCVDNLPVTLLPMLAELTLRAGSEIARAAVVVDVREGKLLTEFPAIFRQLQKMPRPQSGADLPRGDGAGAGAAVQRDAPAASAGARTGRRSRASARSARRCAPIRELADDIVDTSDMTVHELRHASSASRRPRAGHAAGRHHPQLRLQARHPGRLPTCCSTCGSCRTRTSCRRCGRTPAATGTWCASWSARTRPTSSCDTRSNLLKFLDAAIRREGKSYLTIGIGCTGGRHRSVAIAERCGRGSSGLTRRACCGSRTGISRMR